MGARWTGVFLSLLLVACGGEQEPREADPIVGVWDDPATLAGMECRADGSVVDLASLEPVGTWRRLEPGRYEQTLRSGQPNLPPLVVEATLQEDLLRFDVERVVCYRRRTWTPESVEPDGTEVEGRFIVIVSRPGVRTRVTSSREYLDFDDGSGLILRRVAGWVFVQLDGTRIRKSDRPPPVELGHRYRLRGRRYTIKEFGAEMERLGHGSGDWIVPMKCKGILEVHEWIELEPPKKRD